MNELSRSNGGILLMVMVIVSMLTVMFIGSVGIVSRELHITSDATQKERIYQVAESGVQRILFLVENADYTLDQLVALSGIPTSIADPVANTAVGTYTLSVVKQGSGQAVDVISLARSPDDRFCSKVSATIKSPSGSAVGPYFAYKWNRSVCPVDTVAPNSPTALPAGGVYNETKNVSLSAEANATIYYTIDSTDPTTSSTVYTSPISISATVTLRAIAVDAAGNVSTIMVEVYTIDTTPPAAPVASPAGGSYTSAQSISLSAESGAAIRYTLDGSTPTVASALYSSVIAISSSKTLKAIALDAAGNVSPIMSEVYTFAFANGAPAIDLIGQYVNRTDNPLQALYAKGYANDANGSGPIPVNRYGLYHPWNGIALDGLGHRLFIGDSYNSRVLVYNLNLDNTLPDPIPDNVIGKTNYTNAGGLPPLQSRVGRPIALAYDSTNKRLFVASDGTHRILVFDVVSITDGEPAINIIGQSTYAATTPSSCAQNGLNNPNGLEYDSINNRLFVADTNNRRMMIFDVRPVSSSDPRLLSGDKPNAINVLGKSSFTPCGAGVDLGSQANLEQPIAVLYDGTTGRLLISDMQDDRVMVFDGRPLSSSDLRLAVGDGAQAINVLGRGDWGTNADGAVSINRLDNPGSLALDLPRQRLFVADKSNNRVVVFDITDISNGENAIGVLGQLSFDSSGGGLTQSTFAAPSGLLYDNTNSRLFVSDWGNNRVMIFSVP